MTFEYSGEDALILNSSIIKASSSDADHFLENPELSQGSPQDSVNPYGLSTSVLHMRSENFDVVLVALHWLSSEDPITITLKKSTLGWSNNGVKKRTMSSRFRKDM